MSSRPTTPHRHSNSRRKLHRSSGLHLILPQSLNAHYLINDATTPLETTRNAERLDSLADAFVQLKSHMSDLSKIHDAIDNRFNEPFAAFLYGLFITMFCNNFPGCPTYEQFESILKAQEARKTVRELRAKVNAARVENERLKNELASSRPSKPISAPRSELLRSTQPAPRKRVIPSTARRALFPSPSKKKVAVAHDDTTTSASDSFVTTPGLVTNKPDLKGPSARSPYSSGPNLDQPPRYMRGLFDKTSSANTRRDAAGYSKKIRERGRNVELRKPVNSARLRLRERPPFR